MRSPWGGGRVRSKPQPVNVIIALLVVAIIVVATTEAVRAGKISLAVVILFAVAVPSIIFHEVSHGIVAYWCGDDTARRAGRLSANPVRHIDPIGTIIVPIVLVLLHAPVFGWAKPVPVALNRLRHPRNQAVLTGLAGPAANALLATIAGLGVHFLMLSDLSQRYRIAFSIAALNTTAYAGHGAVYWGATVLGFLGIVNVFIGAFNLIPIPPLDGSALLERFIPVQALPTYYRFRIGFLVLVFLLVFFDQGLLETIYFHLTTWYMGLVTPGGI